jgi:DNA-binding MarR family transcriptional regulator
MLNESVTRAVLHPVRLAILVQCEQRPSTVAELASALDVSARTVKRHVRVLSEERLLHGDDRYRTAEGWGEIVRQLEVLAEPDGAEIAERIRTASREEAAKIVRGLSIEEIDALGRWAEAGTDRSASSAEDRSQP